MAASRRRRKRSKSKISKEGKNKNQKNHKKREATLRAAFVKMLMRSPVKDVVFSKGNNQVSLTFLGDRFYYRVVVKREVHVGGWSRRRDEIRIDKELLKKEHVKSFKALCVHEAVEKHLAEKYGLKIDEEAHHVATKKEKQFLKSIEGNWRSHQMVVHHLWLKLDGH